MMQEQRRHQYLDALGIPSWLPRAPLPGARPSRDWVWGFRHGEAAAEDDGFFEDQAEDAPQSAAIPAARQSVAVARPQGSGAGRAALLGSFDTGPEARKAPVPVPEVPAAPPVSIPEPPPAVTPATAESLKSVAAQEVPEFKLAFLQLGDTLLIDSLPPQSRMGLTSAHQRLSTALLRALGVSAEQAPSVHLLPWPAFTSRTLDQGWEQAEAAVQRKLDRMLEAGKPRFLLLLGEAAAQLVLRTREPGEATRGILFHPRSQLPAVASASLSEMLQVPGCKREVWRDLQPLIRHLADG